MSLYEDLKQALEISLAPSIAQIKEDTAAMKAEVTVIKAELKSLNELTEERFKRLDEKIAANHREVMTALNLDKRMAIIEDRQQRKQEAQ